MEKFSFSENYKKAEKEYNLGRGEYFKMKEGQNKVRLVSICLPHSSEYKGKPTFKWLCQVLDRADGKVKPFFMPVIIYKGIEALQLSDDFGFDGVPMPYDLVLTAKGAGTKEVNYAVLPSKEKPLTSAEYQIIANTPTVQELQQKIKNNELVKEQTKGISDEPPMVEDQTIQTDDISFE